MGFLDNFLRDSQADIPTQWESLTSVAQLDALAAESAERPVVLFKHSTRCGISAAAKHRLETEWDFSDEDLRFYYLDLLAYRAVSDAIARRFGVIHQSPQLIVLHNGEATFDTSHHRISVAALRAAL